MHEALRVSLRCHRAEIFQYVALLETIHAVLGGLCSLQHAISEPQPAMGLSALRFTPCRPPHSATQTAQTRVPVAALLPCRPGAQQPSNGAYAVGWQVKCAVPRGGQAARSECTHSPGRTYTVLPEQAGCESRALRA